MFLVCSAAILMTMALALVRAVMGPSVYDRVLAVNMFGTKTVLLIAVLSLVAGRPAYLDLALAYALINFIGVLAVLIFFQINTRREQQGDHSTPASPIHSDDVARDLPGGDGRST